MNIEGILKTGALVEIEYTHEDGKVTKLNTLIDYPLKDGFLTIYAPMIRGAVFPMREYETLWLIFMTDNADKSDKDVFKIKCRIEQRGYTNGIAVYKLFKLTNPEKVQRRSAFRLPIVKDMELIYGENHEKVVITTNNISGTGVKAMSPSKLEPSSTVIVNFDTDEEMISFPAKVVVCNMHPDSTHKYDLRLQFLIEKETVSKKLNAYLFRKQSEVIQKNSELFGEYEHTYRLYDGEQLDPVLEAAKRRNTILVTISVVLTAIALGLLSSAIPQDPFKVFKTLRNINFSYDQWNYTELYASIIVSGLTAVYSSIAFYVRRLLKAPSQNANSITLIVLTLVNLLSFAYGYYLYTH